MKKVKNKQEYNIEIEWKWLNKIKKIFDILQFMKTFKANKDWYEKQK
jgi:hypothetical protein